MSVASDLSRSNRVAADERDWLHRQPVCTRRQLRVYRAKGPQWGHSIVERPPENGRGELGQSNLPDFLRATMVEWSFVMHA
jgi:hypothetical protein